MSALKHHSRAVLVGRTTSGEAAEEYLHALSDQFFLKMADIEILNPEKKSWNKPLLRSAARVGRLAAMGAPKRNV